jgi:SAM-dependent methyltransferase
MTTGTDYNRIRKEITAYDEIARRNVETGIESMTRRLVGENLLAQFGKTPVVEGFPYPSSAWLDSQANPVSELDAYKWLAPIKGSDFLQLGGSGSHAIKALIGGANSSSLLTPMAEEGLLAARMAKRLGLSERLDVVQAIGEQLPFADESVDRIFGGGTLHHIQLGEGFREIARILKPGGRAAFVDPNLNFIYRLLEVTRIRELAREDGAQCYPLRVADVRQNATGFRTVKCELAGGPLRYVIVGLTRVLKMNVPISLSLKAQSIETGVLTKLKLKSLLGGLAVLIEK